MKARLVAATVHFWWKKGFCTCNQMAKIEASATIHFWWKKGFYKCNRKAKIKASATVHFWRKKGFCKCNQKAKIEASATIHFWRKKGFCKCNQKETSGRALPKLSRILPQKGAVSPSPAWLKKFEPIVIQNSMTIRRFFIIVIEKYLGKESNSKRRVPIKTHLSHTARFHSCRLKDKLR
ncbi:hypothetical protein AVEN_141388-1 [Araneus ventricosus]|uniref:Uncharacterized protein n=1 Tax=Araneus ventricosus TaxID=182803 RepID=A0A4Y2D0G9_ARAVE|nr:hypothetical protein AVEN_141388-1 [Araneus ventricosus]